MFYVVIDFFVKHSLLTELKDKIMLFELINGAQEVLTMLFLLPNMWDQTLVTYKGVNITLYSGRPNGIEIRNIVLSVTPVSALTLTVHETPLLI